MSILYDVPAGKVFTLAGPAHVRVGSSFETPLIVDSLADLQTKMPVITELSPPDAEIGAADFPLIVTGDVFDANSVIVFADYDEPTTFNADGTLSTIIKPSLWGAPVTVKVSVRNGPAYATPVDFEFTDPATGATRRRRSHAKSD
jgi:hypothetical protein